MDENQEKQLLQEIMQIVNDLPMNIKIQIADSIMQEIEAATPQSADAAQWGETPQWSEATQNGSNSQEAGQNMQPEWSMNEGDMMQILENSL